MAILASKSPSSAPTCMMMEPLPRSVRSHSKLHRLARWLLVLRPIRTPRSGSKPMASVERKALLPCQEEPCWKR